MFDIFLKNDDPLVRYAFSATVIFGGLYLLATTGILSVDFAWLFGVIIALMVIIRQYGRNKA